MQVIFTFANRTWFFFVNCLGVWVCVFLYIGVSYSYSFLPIILYPVFFINTNTHTPLRSSNVLTYARRNDLHVSLNVLLYVICYTHNVLRKAARCLFILYTIITMALANTFAKHYLQNVDTIRPMTYMGSTFYLITLDNGEQREFAPGYWILRRRTDKEVDTTLTLSDGLVSAIRNHLANEYAIEELDPIDLDEVSITSILK